MQLSVQHSGKRKCSYCVAGLHVFACNPILLCNALLGRFAPEEWDPGDVKSISERIAWMFAAMSNISYFERKFKVYPFGSVSQMVCPVSMENGASPPVILRGWLRHPWLKSNIQLSLALSQVPCFSYWLNHWSISERLGLCVVSEECWQSKCR